MPSPLVLKLHSYSDITSQPYKPAFYSGYLSRNISYSSTATILSFIAEILLFNLVFHDGVTPISVLTLKPLLGVIGAIPLKPRASPIVRTHI